MDPVDEHKLRNSLSFSPSSIYQPYGQVFTGLLHISLNNIEKKWFIAEHKRIL